MNENSIQISNSPKQFSNVVGIIFSCLGCVIGTGNIWRFPRILARNSGFDGAACFFIIWTICLFTWSIPLLVIEYGIGRNVKRSPLQCYLFFMGKIGMALGGWITFINLFIGSYYMVIVGWCIYYIYLPMKMSLPSDELESKKSFDYLTESYWSFIPFTLCCLVIAASVIGGIKIIEKVNIVLVPILLTILLGIFFYSSTLQYSEYGFQFLFSVDWKTLANPRIYLDAISQNAFDTSAASGLITAYAMYLTKSHSIMRYSLFVPVINNLVSLLASMTIFPAVFGIMLQKTPTVTQTKIVEIIKGGGLAGTGLTFIWIPVLLETLGIFGRVLCSIFFVCLSFAGISSLISIVEIQILTLKDFGISRKIAVLIISICMFLLGSGSILQLNFLINQDNVWGFSLIISGLIYTSLVFKFGPFKFRKTINEEKSKNDFNLPFVWVIIITVIVPLEAAVILIWWIYSEINENHLTWFIPGWSSLITTWIEWILFAVILGIASIVLLKSNSRWIKNLSVKSNNAIQMKISVYRSDHIYDSGYTREVQNNSDIENPTTTFRVEVRNSDHILDNSDQKEDLDSAMVNEGYIPDNIDQNRYSFKQESTIF